MRGVNEMCAWAGEEERVALLDQRKGDVGHL